MSIPRDEIVTCPICGRRFETTLWETVNCEIDADLPQKLISGEFFSRVCPGCRETIHIEHPLLYNDLNHDTFVQVAQSEEDYRSALEQGDYITSMIPNFRVVRSTAALSEKVTALENGLDDRVIELCRYMCLSSLMCSQTDFVYQDSFYQRVDGKDEFIFYDESGKSVVSTPGPELYRVICERMHDALELSASHEYEVDLYWAIGFMEQHMDLLDAPGE